MWSTQTAFIVTLMVPWTASSAIIEQECWNLAYRYCCYIQPDWQIPCPGVPGGYCEGVVGEENINDFKQTLIPPTTGAMTAASFERVGDYACIYHPPICHQQPVIHCAVDFFSALVFCDEWARKTQFSWCSDEPQW